MPVVVCPFTDKFRKRSGFLGKGFYCMPSRPVYYDRNGNYVALSGEASVYDILRRQEGVTE